MIQNDTRGVHRAMEILLADTFGFCVGVRLAVDKAEAAAQGLGKGVFSLGPLIHNPQEVERLGGMGIRVAGDPDAVEDTTVVIRAHGAPPLVYDRLASRGVNVVDATCPFVSSLQNKAVALANAGYQVIIVGDPSHPEVIGVVGWTDGRALVVSKEEDLDTLPPLDRVGVVAQTTQREDKVRAIIERLRTMAREVQAEHTICRATSERQESARQLAGIVPVMVVIGGVASSNTQKLVSICRDAGAVTYHVETARDLRPEWFRGVEKAGVTAGASTPDWIVKEVVGRMEELAQAGEAPPDQGEPPGVKVEPETLADMEMRTLRRGQVVEGTVIKVTTDHLVVDVGYKSEGLVPLAEMGLWASQAPDEAFAPGMKIPVIVMGVEEPDGDLKLSVRRAREREAWRSLQRAFAQGVTAEAHVREAVKGGLLVDIGVRAFLPASHVESGYVPDLSAYVGRSFPVRIIELDRGARRVVVSRKTLLEEERGRLREQTLAEVQEGQVRRGLVKGVTDFGAFVDLGGIDGLLHVSEMSWNRVEHPSQLVSPGQEIEVKVLRVDHEKGKIALGLKQVLPDPWADVERRYPAGSWIAGRVARIAPFGAFVELEAGVEGLVHVSQFAPRHVADPREVVQEGDAVQVRVVKVSARDRRISLSLLAEVSQPEPRRAKVRGGARVHGGRAETPAQEPAAVPIYEERMTLGELYGDLLEQTKARLNGQQA